MGGLTNGTTHDLSSLTDGIPYVYYAYSDSACTTAIAQGTFNTVLYPPTNVSHSSSNVRVRAFKTTGGVTISSAWLESQ